MYDMYIPVQSNMAVTNKYTQPEVASICNKSDKGSN